MIQNLFLENAFYVALFFLPMIVLLFVFAQILTKPVLRNWGIGLAVLMVGLVIFERLYVTDRERLDQLIYHLADEIQRNDVDGLLSYVSENSPQTYQRIKKEIPDYRFRSCRITRRNDLQIDYDSTPLRAKIDFSVVVDVDATIRYGYNGRAQRNVILTFEKEGDAQWRVVGFDHYDPRDANLDYR
ncbi:MAG: hypothetical protein KF851_03640 [Pirellulaceae bacterium]|nr:hypothetical protein [Pirellulaceae bacterium]